MFAMDHGQDFYSLDHRVWFRKYATDANGELFVTICWCIWKSRNSEIFSDTLRSDWYMNNHIRSLYDSIIKAFGSIQNSKPIKEVNGVHL